MNLYKRWNDMVVDYVKTKGEKAFWDEYSKEILEWNQNEEDC